MFSGPDDARSMFLSVYRQAGMEMLAHVNATQDGMLDHYRVITEKLLRETKCDLSVDQVEEGISNAATFDELEGSSLFQSASGRRFLRRGLNRLKDFWNYTPRSEFDGRSPTQQSAFLLVSGADDETLAAVPIHVPSDFFGHG